MLRSSGPAFTASKYRERTGHADNKKEAIRTTTNRTIEYVCPCPSFYLLIVFGVLLFVSGATSLLYLSNLWTQIELRYAVAVILVLTGVFLLAASARPRR